MCVYVYIYSKIQTHHNKKLVVTSGKGPTFTAWILSRMCLKSPNWAQEFHDIDGMESEFEAKAKQRLKNNWDADHRTWGDMRNASRKFKFSK